MVKEHKAPPIKAEELEKTLDTVTAPKRGRGRPKGSKNKPKPPQE